MENEILIRQATRQDAEAVSDILKEAARWLAESGMPMWPEEQLGIDHILPDVNAGLFYLAEKSGNAAGTMKFQMDDPVVWPDARSREATYIHRLAVGRRYAGTGISTALLKWAVTQTQLLGRPFVRLDCHRFRPRLRAMYERFGFRHHSDAQVGSLLFARYEYDVSKFAP
jgi:GNAT superfamily N-acetyltransferase